MRNLLSLLLVLTVLGSSTSYAQDFYFSEYDWEETAAFDTQDLDTLAEVVLLEHTFNEYYFKGEDFLEFYTWHMAVYVNSDKAIESHNKQYIPVRSTIETITEKARVITPSGGVTLLDQEDIKTIEDESTGASYRYFAIEGIETGSVIELFIQQTRVPDYTGARVFFQEDIPVYNRKWVMLSPRNLTFEVKSYNGLESALVDTTATGANRYTVDLAEVSPLDEDVQSAYDANRLYAIYMLVYNKANGADDFNSYSKIGQTIHGRLYDPKDKKVEKKLNALLKASGVSKGRDEEDKVRTLENYLKENFGLIESDAPALSDYDFITENSVYSERGASYLTANLLKKMGVKHDLVVTSDRFSLPFDKDLECYIFLQDLLIYLTDLDMYLAPGSPFLRIGVLPQEAAGNHALFISEVKLGDFTSAVSEVKKLPNTDSEVTRQDINVRVDLTQDLFEVPLHYELAVSGYYAQYLQPIYQFVGEDVQQDIVKEQIQYFDDTAELENIVVKNERSYNFGKEPFIIETDFKSSNFTESLGENVLFKIGQLIGLQSEMYQEQASDRKTDIETDFARSYLRSIQVSVPEDYTLSGLDQLDIDHSYKDEEGYDMAFKSTYTMEGDLLEVTVIEYYKNQRYPKELFNAYKSVINAAADFNKISLVLKKN